ncbi:phosphoribosyltransferase [Fodinicola feengrottensis]|uniref:Phosphoribosyltransferase n=1 Tax=Fodinicola feengrottensis TaxID=435914 RepID=A0ABN2H250_9ACTN
MIYANRHNAGVRLAGLVADFVPAHPLVLALPRGGVPVAAPVAAALGCSLDVLVVRKIGLPWQPEMGVGAIAEGGASVLDEDVLRQLRLDRAALEPVLARERAELDRRVAAYRDGLALSLAGRTVVLVDDGLARGVTARAAVAAAGALGATAVWLAVPVAAPAGLAGVVCDRVICPWQPAGFGAVGQYYRDFAPVPDSEVQELLRAARPC